MSSLFVKFQPCSTPPSDRFWWGVLLVVLLVLVLLVLKTKPRVWQKSPTETSEGRLSNFEDLQVTSSKCLRVSVMHLTHIWITIWVSRLLTFVSGKNSLLVLNLLVLVSNVYCLQAQYYFPFGTHFWSQRALNSNSHIFLTSGSSLRLDQANLTLVQKCTS